MSQGIRKAAPPFCATMRGNRHMFPVPIAMPRQATIRPHRDEKVSCLAMRPIASCAAVAYEPSSSMSPTIATLRVASMSRSISSARANDSGFAL